MVARRVNGSCTRAHVSPSQGRPRLPQLWESRVDPPSAAGVRSGSGFLACHRRRVFQRIPPASWGPQAGDSQLSDARALGMPVENRPRGQPARAMRATASFSLLAPFAASLIGSRYSRRGVDRAPSQFRGPIPAEAFEPCADAGPLPGPRCRDWRTNGPDFRLYRSPPVASPPSTRILLHARLVPRKASATGVCADL